MAAPEVICSLDVLEALKCWEIWQLTRSSGNCPGNTL